jgi:predicted nucleic acid-binding protein
MKPTKDKFFLDTNIIIYAHSNIDNVKQKTAQNIISENTTTVSTQVLQETANTLVKKFKQTWPGVSKVLEEAASNNELHLNSKQTIVAACQIAENIIFHFTTASLSRLL